MANFKQFPRHVNTALRHAWWGYRLSELGDYPDIQPNAHFEFPEKIRIGRHCRIARHTLIRANTAEDVGVSIGNNVYLQEYVTINANRGHVRIGNDSWLGPYSLVYGNGGVNIGSDVIIASHCAINTVSHHADRADIPMNQQGTFCDPVTIEDDVWIGIGVIILQGVRVGRSSIIGAGAVVTRDILPGSVSLGVPARVTRLRQQTIHQHSVESELTAQRALAAARCQ